MYWVLVNVSTLAYIKHLPQALREQTPLTQKRPISIAKETYIKYLPQALRKETPLTKELGITVALECVLL